MEIEKLSEKVVRINKVIYNLEDKICFQLVKKMLPEKEFNELLGIKELKKVEVSKKKIVNTDYIVDEIEVNDDLGINKKH